MSEPEEGCRVCGVEIIWHANNDDWNLANGSPYGFLCPNHFIEAYERVTGTQPIWAVRRDI